MLGVARTIVAQKLPVGLRLLILAVENAIGSDDEFWRGYVVVPRRGKTSETSNTGERGMAVVVVVV